MEDDLDSLQEDIVQEMAHQDQLTEVIMNLVTLAIKANDVVIQGVFPGANADEVNALLKMCNKIVEEYVEQPVLRCEICQVGISDTINGVEVCSGCM